MESRVFRHPENSQFSEPWCSDRAAERILEGMSPTSVPERTVPFVPSNPRGVETRDRVDQPAREAPGIRRSAQPLRSHRRRRAGGSGRGSATSDKPPRVRRRLKPGGVFRRIRRFRIVLALMLALCAAAAALLAGERSEAEMVTVVRLTSDVVSGDVLSAGTVEETEVHAEAVPSQYDAELAQVLGQTAAVTLPAGAVLHSTHLVGPGLLAGHEAGTVAVPVRPADTAIIGLLKPGQRVDVTVSPDSPESEEGSYRIAEAAPVIWIPQDESENWLGASSDAHHVVILAVDAPTAAEIADVTRSGRIHLTMVGAHD